jgi:hypothetical protein
MPIGMGPILSGDPGPMSEQITFPQQTPLPTPPVEKPSLFKRILSGALLGMGAGLAAERPEQAFGAGLGAVESARDRQLQRQMMMEQAQREQQKVGLEQQRVGLEGQRVEIERQQAANQKITLEAQAGAAMVSKLHTEKLIALLPVEEQRKQLQAWSQAISMTGLQPVLEINETDRTNYLQQMQAEGKKLTDYTFGPSLTPGKITVCQSDPTKKVTEENAIKLSTALGMKIPAGIPVTLADSMIRETIQARSAYAVATVGFKKAIELARIQAGIKVPTKILEAVSRLDTAEATMKNILFQIEKHPEWMGGVWAGGGALKGKFRSVTRTQQPGEASFDTLLVQTMNEELHRLSGAAVSAQEFERLKAGMPNRGMNADAGVAAAKNFIQQIQLTRQNLIMRFPGLAETIDQTEPKIGDRKKITDKITVEWNGTDWVEK